ncbi:carboxymuconolactone decarboxylase family protein [Paraburkholderia rhizosphaerae]|uniref:Putative peroxidase-related enzyme n=1 Tax=Paraburkholderia rhizosphaerae TaxID=480658 RepID=A0A4R8LV03_9BURK|nr:peroxidase-related enzyme [Paraburkholderia rhizosphaerae]TDY51633.1 putative peroxidase-related enzyme [Paraburkholderia rhizosphaerae]
MARLQSLSIGQAPASAQTSLHAVEKAMGFLPNTFKILANSPAALGAYLQAQQQLSKGELSAAERETVALAVSQVSSCEYCLAAHSLFASKAGLSADAIRAARNGEGNAIAVFARKVASERGRLSDADIAAAREAGITDSKIVEIVAVAAQLTFTNFLNNLAQPEVDFPAVAA